MSHCAAYAWSGKIADVSTYLHNTHAYLKHFELQFFILPYLLFAHCLELVSERAT